MLSYSYRDVLKTLPGNRLFEGAFFLPLENPFAYRWLIRRLKPRRVFFFETELWPALLTRLAASRVPTFLLNAYLYDRDFSNYRRWGWLFRPVLKSYRFIGTQTEADRKKFETLARP